MSKSYWIIVPANYEYNDQTYNREGWLEPLKTAYSTKEAAYRASREQVIQEIFRPDWKAIDYAEDADCAFDVERLTALIETLNKRPFLVDEGLLNITPYSLIHYNTGEQHWDELREAVIAQGLQEHLVDCMDLEFNTIQEIVVND